ncbi:MAG: hypothetical protein LBQ14_06365, partial [Treponema sp.]|nr:hypothetical protein [Treponema sp.]
PPPPAPRPPRPLSISLGGTFGLAEFSHKNPGVNLAARGKIEWRLPVKKQSLFSLYGIWSSGELNETVGPFIPIATIAQGKVFTPKLSGLGTLRGSYTVKLNKTFSLGTEGSCFFRTDNRTFSDRELKPGSSPFLGSELYGSLQWAPTPDFLFNFGGGAFFPNRGGAFISDAPIRWTLRAGLVISI